MEQTAQLQLVEDRYAAAIKRELEEKVEQSLERKFQAAREHRAYRLRRMALAMRAQLALLEGLSTQLPTRPTPEERRSEARWVRQRQYMCLVAEERSRVSPASAQGIKVPPAGAGAGGEQQCKIIATVTLCLSQPEALLPPPFPSSAPTRLYVSNMAVLPEHRRQGVARALLRASVRVASLWGFESLWLHVHKTKDSVIRLYSQEGFKCTPTPDGTIGNHGRLPTFLSLMGEVLLVRSITAWPRPPLHEGEHHVRRQLLAVAAEALWADQVAERRSTEGLE